MHEYTSTVRIWELTCPGFREEIGRIRRWTRDILIGSPHADDAALIVTELATNALLHSSSSHHAFHITVARSPRTVAISVTDAGGKQGTPHIAEPDDTETHGRGLSLVSTLADQLRIHGDEKQGHTITAELHTDRPSLPQAGQAPTSEVTTC